MESSRKKREGRKVLDGFGGKGSLGVMVLVGEFAVCNVMKVL